MKRYITKIVVVCGYCLLSMFIWHSTEVLALEGGSIVGRHIFGLANDVNGDPLLIQNDPLIYTSGHADHRINVEKSSFMISLFDHPIGSIYVSEFDSKGEQVVDTFALDASSVGGVSAPNGGVITSWNSVLYSEQASIDTAKPNEFVDEFSAYFKNDRAKVKPYDYGWLSEVILLNDKGDAKIIKNYAVGRVAASSIALMPDEKTLYLLDAKKSGNLYLFISEEAKSLSKGTLYQVQQQGNDIIYNKLFSTSALKAKFKLNKITFDDIFQSAKPVEDHCETGFKFIDTAFGKECLKLKSKNRNYSGVFEPIRTVALKGGMNFVTEGANLELDPKTNNLLLSKDGKTIKTLVLGENSEMNSAYILEAVK